ncbi:MAG: MFS family permease, partial [Candidatus Paceibacteria bacterium]
MPVELDHSLSALNSYLRLLRSEPRLLAFGFVLTFFSSFGQTFFISLFGGEIRSNFGLSNTDYGLTYSVATLCSGLTIIRIGRKIDTVDLRRFTLLLCAGLFAACALVAGARGVAVLSVGFFLLRLCGQGLLSHAALTSMSRYFGRQRGKALSIAGLGFPVGEAILPILAVLAIGSIGWREAWSVAAGAVVVCLVPAVIYCLRGHEERHRVHLEGMLELRTGAAASDGGTKPW